MNGELSDSQNAGGHADRPIADSSLPVAGWPRPRLRDVVRRGLHRRCPRCGEGPLFVRWIQTYERCPHCGLRYQRNYGDTWFFLIITDRLPIGIGVAAVYFGFRATNWIYATGFLIAMAVPMIASMRERQGLALALDYYSRVYLPDPSDDVHGGREVNAPPRR